jgi:ABC-type nitrate/sulfonate/bicarbonate transport system substrate-binding protein
MFATPSRTLFALPYWIAEHRGFFKDEGISPRIEIIGSGEQIKASLRSGEILMSIDPADGVMTDVHSGGPLRILAGNARKPPLFVIAQPEIRTLADLRGKTFGVLSLREGSSKFIPKIAAAAGLSPSDYKVVEIGGAPTRVKLLAERKIDVALQPMPLNYEAQARGYTDLGWTGVYEPDYQFTTLNANIEWARREPQQAARMLRALLRGQRFALTDPETAARIVAIELRTEEPYALQAIRESARLGILDPELNWSEAGLNRIFLNLKEDGLVPPDLPFEIGRYVAPEYLRQAKAPLN